MILSKEENQESQDFFKLNSSCKAENSLLSPSSIRNPTQGTKIILGLLGITIAYYLYSFFKAPSYQRI